MRWSASLPLLASALTLAGATAPSTGPLPAGVAPPPVPADNPMRPAKVALGRRLFYDADLSINGTLSCATCHDQRQGFADGVSAHPGAHGDPGLRNVPSLVNVAWVSPLTWGNPALITLEAQAAVPIMGTDPVEMGMKGHEAEIASRLAPNPCYRKLFRAAFPETGGRIDLASATRALASFERTIVSFDTAWDRAQSGGAPLPAAAQRGELLFRGQAGCASCHAGKAFTDLRFHPFANHGADTGLARATGRPEDANLFRTPSLRNVALTAPYLHDGSAPTLAEAMARHGKALKSEDVAAISAFLEALTDRAITENPRLSLPGPACRMDY